MSVQKKDKEVKILKQVMQMIGERDQGIQQAFTQFDQKVAKGFGAIEYKIGVVLAVLGELGITEEKINEIASKLTSQKGGGIDEKRQSGKSPTEGIEHSDEAEQAKREEGGDEHFG